MTLYVLKMFYTKRKKKKKKKEGVTLTVVQHILKTNFHNYGKGEYFFNVTFKDFLGDGIFNVDGESWKFQR